MGRPLDKHIDEQELSALGPSSAYGEHGVPRLLAASIAEAERHVACCAECRTKVAQYRQLVGGVEAASQSIQAPQLSCPIDIDWHEVAAGLWPELRTRQLIVHAAQCPHCGPLLRAAASDDQPTAQEEEFLAQLNPPSRPALPPTRIPLRGNQHISLWRSVWNWKVLVPACALLILLAILSPRWSSSLALSGTELAQFAATTHEQHVQGGLALDLQTDSQARLNEWLHEKSEFALGLPASSELREQLPYRIEGARLISLRNKSAAYIAYQMQSDPVSLIVAPISVAVASGGVEVAFKKVNFHYYSIHGYKVVTWSVHGLTYALVSQEGNKTQRSCMVCHSAMRDRDLSNTPTPLTDSKRVGEPFLE